MTQVLRERRVEATLFAGILALAITLGAGVAHGEAKYVFAGVAALILSVTALTAPRYLSLLVIPAFVLVPPTVRIPSLGAGLTPLRLIVAFGVAGWLVNSPRTQRMPIGYRIGGLAFSVYVLLIASPYALTSITRGVAYSVESFAIAWLAWRAINNKRDLFNFLDLLIGVIVIAALLAVYETITGHFLLPADGALFFHAPLRDGHIRAQGVFPHPLVLGAALAIMLPIAISRIFSATGWRRILGVGASVLYALTLILIEGRGPWIGAICAVIALAVLLPRRERRTIVASLLVCVLAVAVSPLESNVASLGGTLFSAESKQEGASSVRYREALLPASISYAESHPFGTGPARQEAAHLTGTLETHLVNSIDNAYAKYAVELGPIGLLLFLLVIASVVQCAWRGHSAKDRELATISSGILAGEIAMLVVSATVATFTWPQLAALFWLVVGSSMILEVLARSSDQEHRGLAGGD